MASKRGFGSIRKLPSGRYQARYSDGAATVNGGTFPTKTAAEIWLADRRRGIDTAKITPAARTTFEAYAKSWLAARQTAGKPLKARTAAHYRGMLRRELLPAFGDQALGDITPTMIRTWYATLLIDKPTMRAHVYSLMNTMMATAVSEEYIDANPCRIRGASQSKRVRKIRPATVAEVEAITSKMPPRLQLSVTCASWLAMRLGEILELRRSDVDLDTGVVSIRRGLVRVGGHLQVTTPKTDAGIRDVAIPPHLLPRFRDHLIEHVRPGADSLLFPSSAAPTRWLQSKALYKDFHRARAEVGRGDLTWHGLRHTGATLAASTGATLAELQARLGHTTPAAAMRYQHVAQGRDQAVAAAMSALVETHVD